VGPARQPEREREARAGRAGPRWKGEGNRASAQRRKREGAALAGPFRPKSDRGRGVASSFVFFL